jgi:pimeloyl-ACP methyl ester carboxylesterase
MHREQRMVAAGGGAELCVEVIGDPGAPPMLLIAGAGCSMDFWDEDLCRRLADHRRLVVRYDHRDTGRSTSYPAGAPGYTGADLAADAVAVLDGLGVPRAHVVGISMGGGIAQRLALEHRNRLITLALIATSPIDGSGGDLPGIAARLREALASPRPQPDPADREAVVEHLVEIERPYAGPGMFDEPRRRAIAGRVAERSRDIVAALTNHDVVVEQDDHPVRGRLRDLRDLPTLVAHGTEDPVFPPAHGRALAEAIPGARLVELEGVGHELPPPRTWGVLVDALLAHATVR